jgi:transposase
MRKHGSPEQLESTRRRAVELVNDGKSQRLVAEMLGVHVVTLARWMAAYRADGDKALSAKPAPGRPRLLTPEQDAQILCCLGEKPTAHGFPTDLWTARRVAELIKKKFGVVYHPSYLREWLTQRGYSPQRPARKARQRNEPNIQHWVKNEWPRVQKKLKKPKPTSS